MRYGTDLPWLALAIKIRTAQTIITFVCNGCAGIPEFLGIRLVSHILQHTRDLSVFDLIKQLSAKLEIIPLLIYGKRSIANNINSFLDIFDHLVRSQSSACRASGIYSACAGTEHCSNYQHNNNPVILSVQ